MCYHLPGLEISMSIWWGLYRSHMGTGIVSQPLTDSRGGQRQYRYKTSQRRLSLMHCWVDRSLGLHVLIRLSRIVGESLNRHFLNPFVKLPIFNTVNPSYNGLVERFHRHLKAAITWHVGCSWIESLPFVLLGIRSMYKKDLKSSTAELVYGKPLRLPGEFILTGNKLLTSQPSHHRRLLIIGLRYLNL